jgi:hypothetical protein
VPRTHRLTGTPGGEIDHDKQEIRFSLNVSEGKPISFVAKFGVAAQVTAGLSRMVLELRRILASPGVTETMAAEEVSEAQAHKERWQDKVLLQLVTPLGTHYTFALPTTLASEIAERLKTESAKPTNVGTA